MRCIALNVFGSFDKTNWIYSSYTNWTDYIYGIWDIRCCEVIKGVVYPYSFTQYLVQSICELDQKNDLLTEVVVSNSWQYCSFKLNLFMESVDPFYKTNINDAFTKVAV